jgi:hypothetical protein
MRRAAGFQSGIKSDRLTASDTATNLHEHMLADRQTWDLTPRNRANKDNTRTPLIDVVDLAGSIVRVKKN